MIDDIFFNFLTANILTEMDVDCRSDYFVGLRTPGMRREIWCSEGYVEEF